MNIGVVIPTLNAGQSWIRCLDSVRIQTLKPKRMLVIDSESTDGTVEMARRAGFEIVGIRRAEFNHGGTRQWAADYLVDCEILIFLTQDAILSNKHSFANLVASFLDEDVAVAYGRQLPHAGATPIEAHARNANYGPESVKKDAKTTLRLGSKVFFCSNSFAAYRRSLLLSLGGFRRDLILGEDMEFAARAVRAGYANMYCAESEVFHSHDYSFGQILERYFDIGVFDAENRWMHELFGSHQSAGLRFVVSEFNFLTIHAPFLIPRAALQTCAKLLGYRLGRLHQFLPARLKRKISMIPGYWK